NFILILFIMLIVMLLQALLPFISKSVIDVGIKTSDINFINMILVGNVIILLSIMIFNCIRDWILMHVTTRVNITLISDYLIKLMKLPISFFETKLVGDILQRARDHERVRDFLINNSLSFVFSVFTFIVFSVVLLIFDKYIFLLFLVGSTLYVVWLLIFLPSRKKLDWQYFDLISKDQSFWVGTIGAMQEIKVYNYERLRRWKWEGIQTAMYKVNKRVLSVANMQNLGAQFIESIKNMVVTFFCATAVIQGEITYGVMISTQFVIGMLNGPLIQLIHFVVSAQYAKISFFRINEIRQLKDEDERMAEGATCILPDGGGIELTNVHFQYHTNAPLVLSGITATIPQNKVTAIVGSSGSGKTTLLKLLVRLYNPTFGTIKVGEMDVKTVSIRRWRERIGVVMQEGHLFNDTILNNIVLGDGHVDYEKLKRCCQIAQIEKEIYKMPKGFETIIGENGRGVSGGQKQRLLIARALYRDPEYLFLDEATNSLDSENEQKIVQALNSAFKTRTVVVIAHRLSTIRNADQILVLENGRLVEFGGHNSLMDKKGVYYRLVSQQGESALS
ncbi:MAG: ATP-binding cassette domain-containing protein, partial [Bacteroidales bacterium]|nr:ATP-binding cassette domain-containing protein [Bacteroidales bacterium]